MDNPILIVLCKGYSIRIQRVNMVSFVEERRYFNLKKKAVCTVSLLGQIQSYNHITDQQLGLDFCGPSR